LSKAKVTVERRGKAVLIVALAAKGGPGPGAGVKLEDGGAGPVISLPGHGAALQSVDFSPDNRLAVSAGGRKRVVWDLLRRKQVYKWDDFQYLASFAGKDHVVSTWDGKLDLWKIGKEEKDGGVQ